MGLMFLAHFSVKLFIFTPTGTARYFTSLGLPSGLACMVMTAELLGAMALLLGIWTRVVAVALTPILAVLIATVHGANGTESSIQKLKCPKLAQCRQNRSTEYDANRAPRRYHVIRWGNPTSLLVDGEGRNRVAVLMGHKHEAAIGRQHEEPRGFALCSHDIHC